MVCFKQMPANTRRASSSHGGDDIPNAPPVPPSLADAIAALVNATTLLAQNQNVGQRGRGRNNKEETTYVDFTDTRPPVFTKADEPLEVDDWLHTMEQKFSLINCTETQKPAASFRSSVAERSHRGLVGKPTGCSTSRPPNHLGRIQGSLQGSLHS